MNDFTDTPVPQEPPTKPVLQELTLSLPCKLTTKEMIERSRQLSKMLDDGDAMEDEHAKAKLEMKEERSTHEAAIRSLRRLVSSGEEERAIECVDEADYETGRVTRIRRDTSQVLSVRPMTAEERQTSFVQ